VGVALEWVTHDERDALRISSARPLDAVRVYPTMAVDAPALLQPMAGTTSADGADAVVFVPRYPFVAGVEYRVEVRSSSGSHDDMRVATIGRPSSPVAPSTAVVAIRPAVSSVPRNLLRLYVEFSATMSEGEASRCVSLVEPLGRSPLADALLTMEPELWDPARRRLTVFLDPARIKRGLVPHEDAGYPLVSGGRVAVVVDRGFRDARGQPLVAGVERVFEIGPDLRGRVDPDRWTIGRPPPTVGSVEPLVLTFDRALDVGLLAHCLSVVDRDGTPVAGRAMASDDGESWAFVPDDGWTAGPHRIVVDPMLEDVAGNSIRRVFDRDLDDPADDPGPSQPVELDLGVFTSRVS
jgi:hypothetical protein